METLRLNASIPGPQPRISPAGAFLNDYGPLPAGTRVSAQAYSLHRNEEIFPEPENWDPYRWTQGHGTSEMMKWFWAFSSGGRMCIGSNLALLGE
jgi:cytochrome P450